MTRQTTAPLQHTSMNATHRNVEDLTHGIRRGSIILNPPYQRGSVWTEDQRIALMRSWLMGVPVAAIILNNRMGSAWSATDPDALVAYAVVDGRQRLETALAWENGDLAIPASWLPAEWIETVEDCPDGSYVRATGLTVVGGRKMRSRMMLPAAEAQVSSVREEAEIYLLVNGGGTPQSDADMDRAARVAEEQ